MRNEVIYEVFGWDPRNWVELGEKLETFKVLFVQPPASGQFRS